jgi:hypothetical protein
MRKILLLALPLLIASCNNVREYYSGIVVDEKDNPLANVLVEEMLVKEYALKDTTDDNGHFRFKRSKNIIVDLMFSKDGYKSDTIPMMWHPGGETTEYSKLLKTDTSKVVLRKLVLATD